MLIVGRFISNPLATIWQFLMGDKPQVTAFMLRMDPQAGMTDGPDGHSFTLRMPSGKTREVFEQIEHGRSGPLQFVAQGAEGGKFYKIAAGKRLTSEPVPEDIQTAIEAHAQASADEAKKKYGIEPGKPGPRRVSVAKASRLVH